MSQFFEDIDEFDKKKQEKSPVPTEAITHDEESNEEDKIIIKERKLSELEEEICDLEKNLKGNKLDNFLKTAVKKYKILLKEDMPEFLYNFLNDTCLTNKNINSSIKGRTKKFLDKYPYTAKYKKEVESDEDEYQAEEEEENLNERIMINEDEKSENLNLMLIKLSASKEKKGRKEDIISLLQNYSTDREILKIYLVLLNIETQERNKNSFSFVCDVLSKVIFILKKDQAERPIIFCEVDLRASVYKSLETILNFLLSVIDESRYGEFSKLLDELCFVDRDLIERTRLYFRYFLCKDKADTSDPRYKLIYFLRNHMYEKARDYFLDNKGLFKEDNDKYTLEILNEFGLMAFTSKDYLLAFNILQECYFSFDTETISKKNRTKQKKIERILLILTIILEKSVVDERFYDVFISKARVLESNPFLLENIWDPVSEIFRAYFYLQYFEYNECFKILNNIEKLGKDVFAILKKSSLEKYQKIIANV